MQDIAAGIHDLLHVEPLWAYDALSDLLVRVVTGQLIHHHLLLTHQFVALLPDHNTVFIHRLGHRRDRQLTRPARLLQLGLGVFYEPLHLQLGSLLQQEFAVHLLSGQKGSEHGLLVDHGRVGGLGRYLQVL